MESDFAATENWLNARLNNAYRAFILAHGESVLANGVLLYAPANLRERNEAYETRRFCPGFVTIGDDGGGRAILLSLSASDSAVYCVDHGSMMPEDFETIAPEVGAWLANACPLPA